MMFPICTIAQANFYSKGLILFMISRCFFPPWQPNTALIYNSYALDDSKVAEASLGVRIYFCLNFVILLLTFYAWKDSNIYCDVFKWNTFSLRGIYKVQHNTHSLIHTHSALPRCNLLPEKNHKSSLSCPLFFSGFLLYEIGKSSSLNMCHSYFILYGWKITYAGVNLERQEDKIVKLNSKKG